MQLTEDALVTVRIGSPDRPPERLGLGRTRIVDGAFNLVLPDVHEPFLYKAKFLFIDQNEDGICTPVADPVYEDFSAPGRNLADLTLVVLSPTAPDPSPTSANHFSPSIRDAPCEAFREPWPDA